MIPKRILTKKVSSTRARKFRINNSSYISKKFSHVQFVNCTYFNYGLMYLYQHYGVGHLNSYFPTGIARKYLINKIITFARAKAKEHHHNLKKEDYGVQSVDKMLESLCVNFIKYRKMQYKARHYWSKSKVIYYLKKYKCGLSGYGRISFKHSLNDIRSVTFKQNHNRIHLINNFVIKIPYFGKIISSQSLAYLKHKKITEVRVVQRRPRDYEL